MSQAAKHTPAEVADSIAKFFDVDQRPPRGGWGIVIDGVPFDGNSESEIFNKVKVWRANNRTLESESAIIEEIWRIYREREPGRHCIQMAMPSFVQRAVNFAGAVRRTIGAIVTGAPVLAGGTEEQRRQTICSVCQFFDPATAHCLQCGCPTASKTALAQEHCPIGKW